MIKTKLIFLMIAPLALAMSAKTLADTELEHDPNSVFLVNVQSPAGKVVSAFHQALESNDPKTARSLLADDVLIFEGGVERSADEYANHHMVADMKYLAAVESKILEHRVITGDDLAASISRNKVTGKYKGKKVDYESLETMTLRRMEGQWKITHIHWSH